MLNAIFYSILDENALIHIQGLVEVCKIFFLSFVHFGDCGVAILEIGCSRSRLDSPESCTSSLFIRVAILTSLSSSVFVRKATFYSISITFSSMVEVLVIIIGMISRYDGENDETG